MQDYRGFAEKNGITLLDEGKCQFCGANTKRGVHECLDIFQLGFQGHDQPMANDHFSRFLIVDAHALQHPEIHGRWSNHFHLTRLHLIFIHHLKWTYSLSPKLSAYLNEYKSDKQDEYLTPPAVLQRGNITSTDILEVASDEKAAKKLIEDWALEVHGKWSRHHQVVEKIAVGFLGEG